VPAGDASPSISVRELTAGDSEWVTAQMRQDWGSVLVARRGELIDASVLPGFLALVAGRRTGLVLVAIRGEEYEIVSISTSIEGRGVGQALMRHCFDDAERQGSRRIWLRTTNNNVRAIAFYQRLGMDLCGLDRHAVTRSRRLKPSIPLRDDHGVPIAHELEFELLLPGAGAGVDHSAE
jgi:GNAT superfamily N-acetyltransferase